MKNSTKVILLILGVLIIDQASKIWVKTHMGIGEEFEIFGLDWARIHFVENEGMAFGIKLGGSYGKLTLSVFRIIAVGFLIYYIRLLIKSRAAFGLLACFALILAGAIGNIIDSAFYGLIFSESPYHSGLVAEMFPEGGGYAGFLHGKVVDMFYFPILEGTFPEWVPFWGGDYFTFFRPVFNVADAAITIGVISLLLFHRSFFKGRLKLDDGTYLYQNEADDPNKKEADLVAESPVEKNEPVHDSDMPETEHPEKAGDPPVQP
ncbi:MAG: lipoprotein signal peptidase [Bacteroidetes bacterium]|nr:MAG: lipoprotein signal peptidase [Bacteroidota bacterium]